MYPLQKLREQWLESYYTGDHCMLDFLEIDDFFVKENQQVSHNTLRYKHIESLVKHQKWQPQRLAEKDLQFHKISAAEYLVTGIAYADLISISFQEKWVIDQDRWRIAYLVMTTMQDASAVDHSS